MRKYYSSLDLLAPKDTFNVITGGGKEVRIRDTHIGHWGDVIGILLFSKEDAIKMFRIMRLTGIQEPIDWKIMDKIKSKFGITYTYRVI
jgi:hypothetical protein